MAMQANVRLLFVMMSIAVPPNMTSEQCYGAPCKQSDVHDAIRSFLLIAPARQPSACTSAVNKGIRPAASHAPAICPPTCRLSCCPPRFPPAYLWGPPLDRRGEQRQALGSNAARVGVADGRRRAAGGGRRAHRRATAAGGGRTGGQRAVGGGHVGRQRAAGAQAGWVMGAARQVAGSGRATGGGRRVGNGRWAAARRRATGGGHGCKRQKRRAADAMGGGIGGSSNAGKVVTGTLDRQLPVMAEWHKLMLLFRRSTFRSKIRALKSVGAHVAPTHFRALNQAPEYAPGWNQENFQEEFQDANNGNFE
ncbi:hypothetical protein GGX14DRAFT_391324 [Mycena pura]|uniref:Uncharacterized protein n=1 Tax=Mycena pura TaxID=153505 RepID=A0AAD6YJS2_9AGAR|nr:hypothetical protein GGX14DRAFT_391324 [Mycena pura]